MVNDGFRALLSTDEDLTKKYKIQKQTCFCILFEFLQKIDFICIIIIIIIIIINNILIFL
jgi:hypothetical protein